MGISTTSMAIFNSYVCLPEGKCFINLSVKKIPDISNFQIRFHDTMKSLSKINIRISENPAKIMSFISMKYVSKNKCTTQSLKWFHLVGGFKHEFLFSISYMGCHPSHWRTHIFQRGSTTNQFIWVITTSLSRPHWNFSFFGRQLSELSQDKTQHFRLVNSYNLPRYINKPQTSVKIWVIPVSLKYQHL